MTPAAEAWLRERIADVPEGFVPWLDRGGERAEGPVPSAMATLGRAALGRATARPGRYRESAFHLLAADAYLTYACEAALDLPDPEEALLGTLRDVLAEFPPDPGGR